MGPAEMMSFLAMLICVSFTNNETPMNGCYVFMLSLGMGLYCSVFMNFSFDTVFLFFSVMVGSILAFTLFITTESRTVVSPEPSMLKSILLVSILYYSGHDLFNDTPSLISSGGGGGMLSSVEMAGGLWVYLSVVVLFSIGFAIVGAAFKGGSSSMTLK